MLVVCVALFELFVAPGTLFRRVTPAVAGQQSGAATSRPSSGSDPFGSVLQHLTPDSIKEADAEAQFRAEHRALQTEINKRFAVAQSKEQELEQRDRDFRRDFQDTIGAPVDMPHFPDDLAWVLAKDRTAAEAWASIQKQKITPEQIASIHDALGMIQHRIEADTIVDDDKQRLDDINIQFDKELSALKSNKDSLDHIGVMLSAERFSRAGKPPAKGQ